MTPTLRQVVWRVLVPVLAIDQLIKVWIKTSFTVGERLDFVPGILELQLIENEGMAFGWALPGVAGAEPHLGARHATELPQLPAP